MVHAGMRAVSVGGPGAFLPACCDRVSSFEFAAYSCASEEFANLEERSRGMHDALGRKADGEVVIELTRCMHPVCDVSSNSEHS